ncbi:MAG: alpha/beta fold hydrolase [Proteobacteria bacterium]|nr:alpha/beta fold hydrolase [Pseudomonadota bacterium]
MVFDYKEVLKYCSELMITERPEWISEHEVIVEDTAYRMLGFNTENRTDKVPVLIIPPQAGHHSCIADFGSPEQSLVNTCIRQTENVVYALEWKNSMRRKETIDDMVLYLDVCVENAGGRAHLIGLCQGGWLATIYAAIYPEKVASLLIGAAPIDFRAGKSKVHDFVDRIPMKGYEWMVKTGGGFLRGDVMLSGWKLTSPYERYVQDYVNLWESIQDDKKLERSKKFRTWYEYTQNISGTWYLQAVRELFKKNKLITGKLRILHRNVNLARISCPVAMIAGEKDDITPYEQVYALADYVSTEKKNMFKRIIPKSGHIGVFMRTDSQPHWADALTFVTQRIPEPSRGLRDAVAA